MILKPTPYIPTLLSHSGIDYIIECVLLNEIVNITISQLKVTWKLRSDVLENNAKYHIYRQKVTNTYTYVCVCVCVFVYVCMCACVYVYVCVCVCVL